MGYTHYWNGGEFTATQWTQLRECAKTIIRRARREGVSIAGWDGTGAPDIGVEVLRLNGRAPHDFETFTLSRFGAEFEFCKTGRRPYDAAIVALLIVAARLNPAFRWRSDGDAVDHIAGEKLARDLPVAGATGGAAEVRE